MFIFGIQTFSLQLLNAYFTNVGLMPISNKHMNPTTDPSTSSNLHSKISFPLCLTLSISTISIPYSYIYIYFLIFNFNSLNCLQLNLLLFICNILEGSINFKVFCSTLPYYSPIFNISFNQAQLHQCVSIFTA